ncbi:DUF6152 family protein [Sphingomonas bacterium]|uniref:DUF6152 family protein n=1 Tax=Sphingomonas bacterium TaxID=1895847 RepID=UPI0015758EDB|nr:DUF6152 family protein [Sphingomonas bacterium]
MAKFKQRISGTITGLATIGILAMPALAHHSFAMFNKAETRVLKGRVQTYQRVNPHGYLDVAVETKSGRTQVWSIELQSTLQMDQQGVGPQTFKPGDPVTLTINPLRNGTTGGAFVSAVLANGKTVGVKPE